MDYSEYKSILNNIAIAMATASTLPPSPNQSDTLAQIQGLLASLFATYAGQCISFAGNESYSVLNEVGILTPATSSPVNSQDVDVEAALSLGLDIDNLNSPSLQQSDSNTSKSYTDDLPRCFDHGCDGRTFSCPENYRRHVREQSQSSRVSCPYCSLSFSRKSNRDTHISNGRCKALTALPDFLSDIVLAGRSGGRCTF